MERKPKYAAFISYRHVSPDKEIAKALQLALEYNLVRPNKNVPRHIRKVFLDTSELPTMEDLDAGILQALDESECLFVICSPDLPLSKYCMREINYFKERHGGSLDRVGTVLVRGEPWESQPPALRTKTVQDPENPGKTIEVDVEPLSADVRGKNLFQSLRKLFFSEYLRLAARYYNCSYDELKKRYKQNLIVGIACLLTVFITVSGALITKDQQVRSTKANTYASYAAEQTRQGDELLALALCTQTPCKATEPYVAALRSALVQYDYKLKNMPVSKVFETDYSHTQLTNYYISASGHQLLVADGNNWQVTDASHGTLIRQFPYESAFVWGPRPQAYVTLASRPDDAGVFRDYLRLIDLETDELIAEFPFREASAEIPQYHVMTLVESDGWLNKLTDRGVDVAYFTSDGQQLTQTEFNNLLADYTDAQTQKNDAPFSLVRDKLRKEYVVKDAQGNTVLSIGSSYENGAFSGDWSRFALASGGLLSVYDTENWNLLGQTELEDTPQSLQLLPGSSYCVVGYRHGSGFLGAQTRSVVLDWVSGEILLTTEGTILTSPSEQAFFTVLQGTITRYNYTQLDLTARQNVIAHAGERCLSKNESGWTLRNTQTGQLLCPGSQPFCTDEALMHILTSDAQALTCYDGSGSIIWTQKGDAAAFAIAPDGSRCAWLDGQGTVHILDAADGNTLKQFPLPKVGQVQQILVSEQGVGILGSEDSLWVKADGTSVSLGQFTRGTLFSDGILILENDHRVNDFRIFDTLRERSFFPFEDNTGAWAYAPATGYLVRHTESSGNNPSLYLEVWHLDGGEATLQGQLDLPEKYVDYLMVDSTGRWLSAASGGSSFVYKLRDLSQLLHIQGQVYAAEDGIFGYTVFGDYQYTMPMYSKVKLVELAKEALTGPLGIRSLTQEEQKIYAISEN